MDLDLYEYYYVPFYKTGIGISIIILGLLCLFSLASWLLYRWYSRRTISAWKWALRELGKQSISACSSKKQFREFYYHLTAVVKWYVERLYGWKVSDKTDYEFIAHLKAVGFDDQHIQKLALLLEQAEAIKFADQEALKVRAEQDLEIVRHLIMAEAERYKAQAQR